MYITEYEVLRIKLSFKQSNKAFCHIGWSLWPGTKSLSIFTSTELTDNKTNLDKKTAVIDFHILLITNWVKKVIHPGHHGTLEWWDLFCLRPIPRGHMCLKGACRSLRHCRARRCFRVYFCCPLVWFGLVVGGEWDMCRAWWHRSCPGWPACRVRHAHLLWVATTHDVYGRARPDHSQIKPYLRRTGAAGAGTSLTKALLRV